MATIDIAFESAPTVWDIRYRLAPIDAGIDLVAERIPVIIDPSDDPIRVSYATQTGNRRVISGAQDAVLRRLRRYGYRFRRRSGKQNQG